jgi:tetratricopeptide (TPR) repeat protein
MRWTDIMIHSLDNRDIGALVALLDAGRYDEAEVRAGQLLGQHPGAGILWKILSVAQLRQGKDALAALQKATELMSGDAEAHSNLGSALHGQGRWADALASLRRALGLRPDDVGALVEAADSLKELGQVTDAITVYQQALRLERRQPDALNKLGNALMQIGQHQEAITAYRLALDFMPDSAQINFNLANAQRQFGQFEQSVVSSRAAIALDARLALAHNNLGLALAGLERRDEAVASFREALAIDPYNDEARYRLGELSAGGPMSEDEGNGLHGDAMIGNPPATPEAEVQRIGTLMDRRQFIEALAAAEELAQQLPESRDIMLAMAVCQRMLGRHADALGTLERLQHVHPDFSRLYQERGYCHAVQKNGTAAAEAFSRAVELNPALPASWNMLEGLYRMAGQDDHARQAAAQLAAFQGLPPPLLAASSLFYDGELAPAESMVRTYLNQKGNHPEALRLLGRIALIRGVPGDAQLLFERALAHAPEHRATRYDYARALMEGKKTHRARLELEKLLALDPANRPYRMLYATACGASGDHLEVVRVCRDLISSGALAPGLRQWLGNALKALGRSEEAVEAYRAAAALRPDLGIAYWSLADLKTYRFTDHELAQMQAAYDAPSMTLVDRYHLCFALGKALEDRGDYAASYGFYARGNALKRSEIRYQPDPERIATRQIETCNAQFLASRNGVGCQSPDPIFIVGLPRSGSTLLEQILASHSRVEGTKELTELPGIVLDLQGQSADMANPRYPGILATLDRAEFMRLGERYLEETRAYRSDRPFFVDKMSGNFRHIGLIHLILPNAKIIDARREPMACCFSNFKQLFASGQEFTYSIDELARYYRSYLELMRHWDRVLPGRVLRVQHEDVVEDLEGSVRKLLDFCGLEFEPACLDFHRNARSVRTASAEQVRQPINRESLDQWKHFEPWLGPLKAALGDALTDYR